jgi:hypothetical protein
MVYSISKGAWLKKLIWRVYCRFPDVICQVSKVDIFSPQGLARGEIVAFRSSPCSLHAQHKTVHSNPKSRAIARDP